MISIIFSNYRLNRSVRVYLISAIILLLSPVLMEAHPMNTSAVRLHIQTDGVLVVLDLPLNGLERSFGDALVLRSDSRRGQINSRLPNYIKEHVKVFTQDNRPWEVKLQSLRFRTVQQATTGHYQELAEVRLWTEPPAGTDTHNFILDYDLIIHRIISHTAFVTIQQDWENGIYSDNPLHVGVISFDILDRTIPPLNIDMAGGGLWKGLVNMIGLGMHHIAEGIDHLLFLLVLLLAAPLLVLSGRWDEYGGMRYSLINLLKIVSAFTIGHSITLVFGTLGWFDLPGQLVEILIALSILISAGHAIRPMFPRRESYVAAGFGLIHGLAFAEILTGLNLDTGQIALSLLGFNIGIELMQLVIVALVMPWLLMLSRTSLYDFVRIGGALFSGIAAIAWLIERVTLTSNPIGALLESFVRYSPWAILLLALLALYSHYNRFPARAEA